MSGDVQPRKRKDKRRKRDSLDRRSDGDLVFSRKQSLQDDEPREHHQGVHGSKMGSDDVHLHVQDEHETGGHWCAKIFFFALLAILFGLVGLIILENRGLSDLDTPLSESRFSNYFDGWVDEHRESHEEHDVVSASIEEHEHGDEPFEEEEDHSEADEADDDGDEKDNETEEDDEGDEEDSKDTEDTEEEEDEDATEEVRSETVEEDDETQEDDDQTEEDEDEEEDGGDDRTVEETVEEPTAETREDEDDDDDAPDNDDEDDNDNTQETNENGDDDDDDTAEVVEPVYTRSQRSAQQAASAQSSTKEDGEDDDDDEPFDEEEDDGTFESLESVVVDNDAEELLLLQEKARKQQEASKKDEPQQEKETSSYTSSLAVKIGVGVALALVARLVLIRKNPNTSEPRPEDLMKRRLTIAAPEDTFPEDQDELLEYDYSAEHSHGAEEEYIEEEFEEEEEIEVTDEEYEEKIDSPKPEYVPGTFEEFNAMYRPPGHLDEKVDATAQPTIEAKITKRAADSTQHSEPAASPKPSRFAQYRRELTPPSPVEPRRSPQALSSEPPAQVEMKNVHYSDDPEEEIEYDDDELYDDEMLDEEEEEDIADDEGDEDDLSDVDDSELMNRLEAKYGRLPPARELDSDEDVEDQSWTKIKSRGGGPQSMDDDAFDEELRKANEEMLRDRYNSALTRFESLSKHFPDKPEVFLGKARALDKLSEIHRSNSELGEALKAYKRYLAFGEDILNDGEFTEVAQRCVDRMRFMGVNLQAIPIHEMLIERFPDEVTHRNQLAVTNLMANRLSDAKRILKEIISRWPTDGFALVHYGFVLKNLDKNLELAVQYLRSGIDTQAEGTQDGRFYFNLGDSLQRLGRVEEAREIYRRAANLKLFLSEYQRSLYNVDTLRAQAFWTKKETGYQEFLDKIEDNWRTIREEGLSALNTKGFFQDETENLRDSGDWKQFELFARGQRMRDNCLKAPITCGIIEMFPSSRFCKRGQVKFSVMHPGTHVWPHCGPTNCRLRAHLGLKVPSGTLLRVANEKRTWQEGKFLIFDDSFEHEVWHNGTTLRLVLIVDVWHPDLTEKQRQSLSPI